MAVAADAAMAVVAAVAMAVWVAAAMLAVDSMEAADAEAVSLGAAAAAVARFLCSFNGASQDSGRKAR